MLVKPRRYRSTYGSRPLALAARVISPAPREVWEETLASDSTALVSQSPAWLDCLCASGGYEDASRLYELPAGRRLLLPMVRRGYGEGLLAIEASFPPSWGTGGVIASGGVCAEDLAAVFADLAGRRVMRASIRPNPVLNAAWAKVSPPWAANVPRLAHVLDLEGGFGRVWGKRFTGSARRAVRKAEGAGLTVECDTTGRRMAQFKTRFGARPFPYAEYHLERLPLTAADHHLRTAVKRILRFRD